VPPRSTSKVGALRDWLMELPDDVKRQACRPARG
jgi:hypothetical protein